MLNLLRNNIYMNINLFIGRLNPPQKAHYEIIEKMSETGNKSYIGLTGTHDSDKNPLTWDQKFKYVFEMIKDYDNIEIWKEPVIRGYDVIRDCCFESSQTGGGTVTVYCGSDRIDYYSNLSKGLLKKYQTRGEVLDVEIKCEEMLQERGEDTPSATKMRQYAKDNDFDSFLKDSPFKDKPEVARDMFEDVRKGLELSDLKESVITHDASFVKKLTVEMAKKVHEHINQLTGEPDILYYVGGCMRDMLLGKTPNDFDLVTTMYYKDYAELFNTTDIRWRGKRCVVVPVVEGEPEETACLFKDQTIEDRLVESDLTMNAIGQDILTGEIIDPLGGAEDIKNKIIKSSDFVKEAYVVGGKPATFIRIFRFYAQLGWKIDFDTMDTIQKCADYTKGKLKVPNGVFAREFEKMKKGKFFEETLGLFKDFGFHDYFLQTQDCYREYFEGLGQENEGSDRPVLQSQD